MSDQLSAPPEQIIPNATVIVDWDGKTLKVVLEGVNLYSDGTAEVQKADIFQGQDLVSFGDDDGEIINEALRELSP